MQLVDIPDMLPDQIDSIVIVPWRQALSGRAQYVMPMIVRRSQGAHQLIPDLGRIEHGLQVITIGGFFQLEMQVFIPVQVADHAGRQDYNGRHKHENVMANG